MDEDSKRPGAQQKVGTELTLIGTCAMDNQLSASGLDLDHVIVATEWLARLHGLSHVLLLRHPGGARAWIEQNPWIRNQEQDARAAVLTGQKKRGEVTMH